MSKMMVKRDGLWTPMANLKGDTGPLPADNSVTNDALVTDGAKTNTAYLMGNRLTATAEGEMISVDDSYPSAALSLTVDGKSTQVTTTGKNLLSDVASDWVRRVIPNVATRNSVIIPIEAGASYHFHDTGAAGFVVGWLEDVDDISTYTNVVTLTNRRDYTFVNTDNHNYLFFGISTSYSQSEIVDIIHNTFAILEKGSEFTSYEPYSGGAASPSTDYPQKIKSIVGPSLHVTGINMFDISTAWLGTSYGGQWYAPTYHGDINTVVKTDGGVLVDPHNSNHGLYVSLGRLPAGSYTISLDKLENAPATLYTYPREPAYGTHPQLVSIGVIAGNGVTSGSKEFTLSESTWVLVGVYRSNNDPMGIFNIQLTPASIDSQYRNFVGTIGSLLPEGTSLRSLPDGTKDELYLTYLRPSSREGWAWYSRELVKKINTVTFDGSERWVANGAWNGFHIARPSDAPSEGLLTNAFLNTRGIAAVHSRAGLASALGATSFGSDSINYNWDNKTGTSYYGHLTEFKAWLTENNMTIQYPLATPITTQLDPIELPIMQAGTTSIWTDPSTSLSVTYERDRNIVISKLEAAAADLATS